MLWIALALAASQSPAQASSADEPSAQVKALLQNCDAHKFETTIEVTVEGKPKKSRVKLCGTEGQSDADWIRTLKDAAEKTSANRQMPPAVRNQIVTALNGEIARLSSGEPPSSSQKTSALDGISALPPLPPPPAPAATALPPPRKIEPAQRSEAYSSLPPLPAAPPPPVHVLAGEGGGSIALLSNPKMSFSCYTPGETDEGPCTEFNRDTMLMVRADEDVPAGTSLRFVRSGERLADVELLQLKRGRSERLPLPSQVCRGVNGGKLEIRVVRSAQGGDAEGQEVASDGPFVLRC